MNISALFLCTLLTALLLKPDVLLLKHFSSNVIYCTGISQDMLCDTYYRYFGRQVPVCTAVFHHVL